MACRKLAALARADSEAPGAEAPAAREAELATAASGGDGTGPAVDPSALESWEAKGAMAVPEPESPCGSSAHQEASAGDWRIGAGREEDQCAGERLAFMCRRLPVPT